MKKLLEYLPFHFLCFLVLGIIIQFHFHLWGFGKANLILFLSSVLLFLLLLKRTMVFELLVYFFFFLLGVTIVFFDNNKNANTYFENHLSDESFKTLSIIKVLKPGNFYTKYEAKVIRVDSVNTIGKVLVNIKKDSLIPTFEVGQCIYLSKDFRELIPPLNPHQFNYKSYLSKQGIHNQVFLDKDEFQVGNQFDFSLIRLAFQIRKRIQKALIQKDFSDNEYAVINALLLGQRQDISKELIDDYAKAGAIHILAVSGLHVGIILLMLNFLFKPLESLKHGKILKAFLVVFLLWCFALVAGLSASVVRAVTMFSAVAFGLLFRIRNSVVYSLVISMFFLLLLKPMFLFDVGFQLSYLAVFGIVWVQPLIYSLWQPKWKIVDYYWQLITVSIAAQVGILPVSLFYFHQFPGLFILSNLMIIPFLVIILSVGIFVIVLSLFDVLPDFLKVVYETIIYWMNQLIRWISYQENWLLSQISFSGWMVIVSYVVIVFGVQFLIKRKVRRLIYFLVSIVLLQSILWFEKWESESKSAFIIFHKSRFSVMGKRANKQLIVYHDLENEKEKEEKFLLSYQVGERIKISFSDSMPKYFYTNNESVLIIDQSGLYPSSKVDSCIIILTNSPKINLDRMIREMNPKIIIANGSNYKSYVTRWEETCLKRKTPFWYTGQKGAYMIE